MFKQIILTLCICILASLPAFGSLIQTNSFAIVNLDAGAGKLSDQSAVPYGLGAGYQWTMGYNSTVGVEGAYFNNGHVSSNGQTLNSYELVPMLSMYYYPGAALNFFGKVGYGWQVNKVSGTGPSTTSKSWEPVAVAGIGFVIPFSQTVYANIYTDLTWSGNGNNSLAGNHLNQNTQIKVGIQFMF